MLFGIPWWVLGIILLIFFSGYMAFRTMMAEKRLDDHYIEQEGKIYMDRIEAKRMEKEERKQRGTE